MGEAEIYNAQVKDRDAHKNPVIEYAIDQKSPYYKEKVDKPTTKTSSTSSGTKYSWQMQEEQRQMRFQPDYIARNGLSIEDGDGFGYKPAGDKIIFKYRSTMRDDAMFMDIPSSVIEDQLPSGIIVEDGSAQIKPISLDKAKGKLLALVESRNIEDTVNKWGRKRELKKMFERQGTDTVVDGEATYYRDKSGVIYRLGDDTVTKEVSIDYDVVSDYVGARFNKLNEVLGMGQTAPTTEPSTVEGEESGVIDFNID